MLLDNYKTAITDRVYAANEVHYQAVLHRDFEDWTKDK